MTDHTTPNTFTNGTEADATQVNANFAAIASFLNATGVHVYQASTIETAALEDLAVTNAKMGAGAAIANIGALGVLTANINDLAVTTGKIADGAVTAAKVAADVFTQAEFDTHVAATGAHAATKISVDSTTLAGTATHVQGSLEELDDAIAAVVSGGVAAGTITSAMILDGEIVDADINAAAEIAVSKLADGGAYDVLQTNSDGSTVAWVDGLTANHLASDSVTSAKILDANVTPPKLGMPYVGAINSASVSIVSGDGYKTVTSAGTQVYETDGTNGVDIVAASTRCTAKRAGYYRVHQITSVTSLGSGANLTFGISLNGTPTANLGSTNAGLSVSGTYVISLAVNDYIQSFVTSTSANSSSVAFHLIMEYIGPAS